MTKPEASTQYSAVRFGYAMNDRTLTHVVGETWEWDENPLHCPTNYAITYAREFRYDGARARYLNREFDPVALMSGNFVSLSDTWTDYDGDEPYGDFEVTPGYPPTVTNRRSYEPGLAQVDPWMSSGSTATDYVMTDHLGTTRLMIGSSGTGVSPVVYTAFGERISGTNHRFGYVGSWGYQSHDELPFLHVGARYYDPATGRFLQRDPIGIVGGTNVYVYLDSVPTDDVDPEGLQRGGPPGGIPTVPGRPAPRPAPDPPFSNIPQTPLPLPSPIRDLAAACNRLSNIWFGTPLLPPPRPRPSDGYRGCCGNKYPHYHIGRPPNLDPWKPKPPPTGKLSG